jgi:hypothetical protein
VVELSSCTSHHDLSLPVLLSRSNTGNTFRVHQALNLEQPAKVLVLGGSLTVGHDAGGMEHAWPALLSRENCIGVGLVENRGKASTGSNYALANIQTLLSPFDWDIILLEYALNDDVGDGSLLVSSRRERFSIEYEG